MSDCLTVLKRARECELEVQAGIEHIERLHRIMRIHERSRTYAQSIAEKLAALEIEVNAQIDEAVDRKREALKCLSALEGTERAVLYRYYILAEDWLKISDEMYISERQIFNIRKKALERLENRRNRIGTGKLQETCDLEGL